MRVETLVLIILLLLFQLLRNTYFALKAIKFGNLSSILFDNFFIFDVYLFFNIN